ncbi:unnamed protein product, partial [Mesorhabditis belari]|uniref:Uncharacterized protein n=1 Tax=Mesorhabditis belari TaxID=2138241 RepID=A0AAF3J6Q7_9BILA
MDMIRRKKLRQVFSVEQSSESYQSSPRSGSLQRRHSAYQPDFDENADAPLMDCDRALAERYDGVDIAFEKTKAWSRYCKELTNYVKSRVTMEIEHAKKTSQLVEQTRLAIQEDFLPMKDLFNESFDLENEHFLKIREAQEHLNERFIKSLESRRLEAESTRRTLKNEWNKALKGLQDSEAEHRKAQQNLMTREDTLKKARESSLRTENYGVTTDVIRKMDKKRVREDEALLKREEALQQVRSLEAEVRRRQRVVEKCKEKTIEALRELVLQCDQTTKACAQHYFKALSALWVGVPARYQELADASRDYQPGREYMAFLQNLPQQPHRANSQHSLLRSDKSVDDLSSQGESCYPKITLVCGQGSRSPTERRISMFGVSLQKQLEEQKRDIPLILEDVIDEIQRRGLRMKGIYRTCGVKSKIEEICEMFERYTGTSHIPLNDVYPMNLASVVKLYLRKLPEPLMTFDLYGEWIRFGQQFSSTVDVDENDVNDLGCLIAKLPRVNYETLKFVILHLNRVSWFSSCNLMSPSNLSTVISPSLCWPQTCQVQASSFIQDAHYVTKTVEIMIANAHSLFNVDRNVDRVDFFTKYPQEEPDCGKNGDGEERDTSVVDEEEQDQEEYDDSFCMQQPPTPDLLKSARKANGAPPSECGSEGSSTGITGAFMNRSDNPPSRFRGSDKRESFTTCIIVAPSTTSAPPTPNFMNTQPSTSTQQQKIPARKQISVGAEGSHYACGDIVLNVSEGQFFVPENGIIQNGDRSPAGKSNHSVFDYGSSSGYSTSECSRESDVISQNSTHSSSIHPIHPIHPTHPIPPSTRSPTQRSSKRSEILSTDKGFSYV